MAEKNQETSTDKAATLEEERVVSVDGALKPGEIIHVKNIYIGQLEANYGSASHPGSIQ